jgi:hypothetical protein
LICRQRHFVNTFFSDARRIAAAGRVIVSLRKSIR